MVATDDDQLAMAHRIVNHNRPLLHGSRRFLDNSGLATGEQNRGEEQRGHA